MAMPSASVSTVATTAPRSSFSENATPNQRLVMLADLFQRESREIVAQNGTPGNLPVLIYGKGAGRFVQRVPFGAQASSLKL